MCCLTTRGFIFVDSTTNAAALKDLRGEFVAHRVLSPLCHYCLADLELGLAVLAHDAPVARCVKVRHRECVWRGMFVDGSRRMYVRKGGAYGVQVRGCVCVCYVRLEGCGNYTQLALRKRGADETLKHLLRISTSDILELFGQSVSRYITQAHQFQHYLVRVSCGE